MLLQDFGRKNLKEENSEDLGINGKIISEWILGE